MYLCDIGGNSRSIVGSSDSSTWKKFDYYISGYIMPRPSDWTCPICKFSIWGSKDECRKCHTKRPGSRESTDASNPMRPGDWVCKGCNFRLFADKTHCFKCKLNKMGMPINENIEDSKLCNICLNNEITTGFLHNGSTHLAACHSCAQHIFDSTRQCPICRQPVEQIIKVF